MSKVSPANRTWKYPLELNFNFLELSAISLQLCMTLLECLHEHSYRPGSLEDGALDVLQTSSKKLGSRTFGKESGTKLVKRFAGESLERP